MENLWSPWRMKYVTDTDNPDGCVFCTAPAQADDLANLIVHRGKDCFAILNRYPYTSGHLMVVPFAHVSSIELLTPEVRAELFEMVNHAIGVLRNVYHPDGFNVGINMGEAAGAGIAPASGRTGTFSSSVSFLPSLPSTTSVTGTVSPGFRACFRSISITW